MTSASILGLLEGKAYIAHHVNDPGCCAASLSGDQQTRCVDGQQLWEPYNQFLRLLFNALLNHESSRWRSEPCSIS